MRLLILFSFILLNSCTSATTNYYTQTVSSWRGARANFLIQQWGTPDQLLKTPEGRTFYLYKTMSYRQNKTPRTPPLALHLNAGQKPIIISSLINPALNQGNLSLVCYTLFEVDSTGKIIDTDIQGNACFANENRAKQLSYEAH